MDRKFKKCCLTCWRGKKRPCLIISEGAPGRFKVLALTTRFLPNDHGSKIEKKDIVWGQLLETSYANYSEETTIKTEYISKTYCFLSIEKTNEIIETLKRKYQQI